MTDERDPRLSQHYRGLEPLEPRAELDTPILASARRAVNRRRNQRWYYSLAAAAVFVLALALTLQIERRPPEPEAASQVSQGPVLQAPQPPAAAPAPIVLEPQRASPRAEEATAPAEERALPPPAARPQRRDLASGARPAADAVEPAAAAAKPAPPVAAAPGPERPMAARAAPEKPDRWLERIAELRSRGRHEEADRQLAEFRRAYPNYPLSEVMRERVEGR